MKAFLLLFFNLILFSAMGTENANGIPRMQLQVIIPVCLLVPRHHPFHFLRPMAKRIPWPHSAKQMFW